MIFVDISEFEIIGAYQFAGDFKFCAISEKQGSLLEGKVFTCFAFAN